MSSFFGEEMNVEEVTPVLPQFESLTIQPNYRSLYGGAIESILLPVFEDISQLRDVPDHQEVFLHSDSEASIIVELVDLEKDTADPLDFYFNDLARHNDSYESVLFTKSVLMSDEFMPHITPSFSRMACLGKQLVKKHRSLGASIDSVYIALVVVRLRNVDTDVLISLNIPFKQSRLDHHRTEISSVDPLFDSSDSLIFKDHSDSEKLVSLETIFPEIKSFQEFLYHFRIQDWSLFL